METYGRFLFEFLDQFFSGFKDIIIGIFNGIARIFNIPAYVKLIKDYSKDFSAPEWLLTGMAIIVLLLIVGLIVGVIAFFVKRHMRWRKKLLDQEELLAEIDNLNKEVETLVDEKMRILDMEQPDLGINSQNFSDIGKNRGGAGGRTRFRFWKR